MSSTPRHDTLPSARQIHAARVTHTEQRTNKHGVSRQVVITDPWPDGFTINDLASRIRQVAA